MQQKNEQKKVFRQHTSPIVDTVELTNIDPEVRIYHTCNMNVPLCKREWVIGVPDKYISSGATPSVVMDLGDLNLEVELDDESRGMQASVLSNK